jgi:hypothetical protein
MIDADGSPRQKNLRSALGGVLFGGLIAAMGAFFMFALWVGFQRAKETRGWVETPCEITRSEVSEERPTPNSPIAYRAWVEYRYEFDGRLRSGQNVKRVDGPTSHRDRAEATVEAFPAGAKVSCWVNPADPEKAVLKHGTLAPLYSIWFPGLFVVGGVGIAFASLQRAKR